MPGQGGRRRKPPPPTSAFVHASQAISACAWCWAGSGAALRLLLCAARAVDKRSHCLGTEARSPLAKRHLLCAQRRSNPPKWRQRQGFADHGRPARRQRGPYDPAHSRRTDPPSLRALTRRPTAPKLACSGRWRRLEPWSPVWGVFQVAGRESEDDKRRLAPRRAQHGAAVQQTRTARPGASARWCGLPNGQACRQKGAPKRSGLANKSCSPDSLCRGCQFRTGSLLHVCETMNTQPGKQQQRNQRNQVIPQACLNQIHRLLVH